LYSYIIINYVYNQKLTLIVPDFFKYSTHKTRCNLFNFCLLLISYLFH